VRLLMRYGKMFAAATDHRLRSAISVTAPAVALFSASPWRPGSQAGKGALTELSAEASQSTMFLAAMSLRRV
jgi:hypothetical protein